MPRTSPFATQNKIISKTERMIHLPNSYYLREKTERMVDLPSFNYGHQEPRIITSNLIYYLDGADNTIRGTDWFNSVDKNSKASLQGLVGLSAPIIEDRSFKFVTNSTDILSTGLTSDIFNTSNKLCTLSVYVKINAISSLTARILAIYRDSFFSNYFSILTVSLSSAIAFRTTANSYNINFGQKYMLTIVKNYDNYSYYINDKFFMSENVTLSPATTLAANITLGGTAINPILGSNCNVYGFLAYNRILTEKEIDINYQVLKEKYSTSPAGYTSVP